MQAMKTQPHDIFSQDSITLGELANYFGWSPRFIEGLARGERLPSVEVGGEIRFRRDEIVDLLQQKIHTLDAARVSGLEGRIEQSLIEDGTRHTRRPVRCRTPTTWNAPSS